MPATVVEKYGSLSATGIAKEAVFGTAVAASTFLPMTGNQLELDPGLFWPTVMQGSRDLNIYGLYGQNKNAGSLTGPLFPTNAAVLIPAAIGLDGGAVGAGTGTIGGGQGVTGTGSASVTSLSAAVASVGLSTITVTSATGYVAGVLIQIDVNVAGVTTSEVRKQVGAPAGSVITLDAPMNFTHLNGAAVKQVTAPFTHTVVQANSLPSLTVEKNLGGSESLQFVGSRINKYQVSVTATNQEVSVTADLIAKHSQVLATPTTIAVTNESPYVFAESTLTLNANTVAQAINCDLVIENGLKDTFTLNGSHDLQFLTPLTRKVSAKCDVVFHNLDDVDWGYWTKMNNGTNMGTFTITYVHPASGGTITFTCPYTRIKSYTDAVKMQDVIISTLQLDMGFDQASQTTISATLVNSAYIPY